MDSQARSQHLRERLRSGNTPGREEWLPIASIQIRSGRAFATDPLCSALGDHHFDPAVVFALNEGTYRFSIRLGFEGQWGPRVLASRLLREDLVDARRAAEIGHVPVDAGMLGWGDPETVSALAEEHGPEMDERILESSGFAGDYTPSGYDTPALVHSSSGFGDWTYVVHELVHGGVRVGAEVEFIPNAGDEADSP